MKKKNRTAAKSMTVAARRARVVAWLPSSTCPHWASRKTRIATEARVPTPAAVVMAVTQASRLQAASPRHIPFWQLHHSQPTSILAASFGPLHSSLCSSVQVCVALFDYEGRAPDELSFTKGQEIKCSSCFTHGTRTAHLPMQQGSTRTSTTSVCQV